MQSNRYTAHRAPALAAALFFACLALAPLVANPFMGAGVAPAADGKQSTAVSPVRTAPADRRIVSKQASLREALGNYFYEWKTSGSQSIFWGIIGAAFLYGMLHALGPGHRKTVIFSLYLARGAPAWEPAGTGLLLSLLHGGAAVVLLLILRGVTGAISGKADNIANWMEGSAYLLLIAVALWLVVHAIVELARGSGHRSPDAMSLGTILITGIYPCPGAILVLVLSLSLDITGIGILAVFAMSIGMSIPVVAAGYLAWAGRTGLFHALKKNETVIGRISAGAELFGYSFLLAFSVYMAMPFIASVARMAGFA
jgi:ABC-type nickel/cobalt efflux system permease component RcnA